MAKYKFEKVCQDYKDKLATMAIKPEWRQVINSKASLIKKNMWRYRKVADMTGVPWEFIGLVHLRESGCDFTKHLHNGDSLLRRTVQVPRGRPKGSPPFTFEESAVDALEFQGLTKISDWSLEHMVYLLEAYNGFGYRMRNKSNPYLWSGTNHYTKGKFVRDGKYDANYVDKQVGLVPVLISLRNTKEEYRKAKKEVEKTSTKVKTGDYLKWTTGLLTSVGLAWNQVWEWADNNKLYIVAALVIGFILYVEWNKRRTIKDYIAGRFFGSKSEEINKGEE